MGISLNYWRDSDAYRSAAESSTAGIGNAPGMTRRKQANERLRSYYGRILPVPCAP
jgi:hypothetical protein